jgi:hypothetical protein
MRTTPVCTVFDIMAARGDFRSNRANIESLDDQMRPNYRKAEFPMMLYHPEGKTVKTVPAELIATPFGAQKVGEKREIITEVVNSQREADLLIAEGWHTRPSLAALQNPDLPYVPQKTHEDEMSLLRAQLARANSALEDAGVELPAEKPQPMTAPAAKK